LKRKDDYRRILGDFRVGKIDILVGTQMIAKGLHFPNVTLVGIICADLALHMPDFRASERTFQLLTQVAGRAGRGDIEGEVVVQSFTPFHPAIQHAKRHNFAGFYEQEIEFREQLKYPPLGRVALLTLKGRNEDKVRLTSEYLRKELAAALAGEGAKITTVADAPSDRELFADDPRTGAKEARAPLEKLSEVIIAGPAPAPLARAEKNYRYQIMLRARQMLPVSRRLAVLTESLSLPEDVSLAVDIDPVDLA
jgi:primosomal protein N' (replication factor Y) (superfamily II helicase)